MRASPCEHPRVRRAFGVDGRDVVVAIRLAMAGVQLGVDFPTGCGKAVIIGVLALEPHDPAEEELTRAVVEHANSRGVEDEDTGRRLGVGAECPVASRAGTAGSHDGVPSPDRAILGGSRTFVTSSSNGCWATAGQRWITGHEPHHHPGSATSLR